MSDKFHINAKGEPGKCSAQHGGCPFGSAEDHYETKEAATHAFERSMVEATIPKLVKAPTRDQVNEVLDAMSRGEDTIPEGVEFVTSTATAESSGGEEPAIDNTPRGKLQSAINDELQWAAKEHIEAHKNLDALKSFTDHAKSNFGKDSQIYIDAAAKEVAAYNTMAEIETYQTDLARDSLQVKKSNSSVNELRETLRERHLKKKLHDLEYDSRPNSPSLKELEEKIARPKRLNESEAEYRKHLQEAGSRANDNNRVLLLSKNGEKKRIQSELDDLARKRRSSELPERAAQRNAEVDASVNKNVALFAQDEENLKSYNSFANRVRRLFSRKKNTLFERSRLDSLPAGRKLIDYDPKGKAASSVWTKTGENRWENEEGKVSTDRDRKLPATFV